MNHARGRQFVGIVCLASALLPAGAAFAQTQTGRPLFGTAPVATGPQELNLTVSVAEAYDQDALAELRQGVSPNARQAPGYHTTLMAGGAYQRRGRRIQLAGTGVSTLRYYNELSELRSVSHTAGLGVSATLPLRMSLRVNQGAAYSPSYLFGLFPGATSDDLAQALPAASDYALNDSESIAYNTSSRVSRPIGRRGSVSAGAEFSYTDYTSETSLRRDVQSRGVNGQYRQGISRNAGISAGYAYRTGEFGYASGSTTSEHRADVGVDFSRPLSSARRVTMSFKVGGSTTDIPESAGTVVAGPKYRVHGEGTLGLQFAPGWQASGGYRRGMEFMPALTEPVFIDGFSASLDGLVTRRIELRAGAGYASGESILNTTSSFGTYTGNVRVQFAATRTLAFFSEYLYYFYDFRGSTQLAPEIPQSLERNGVRGGFVLLVPAIGR